MDLDPSSEVTFLRLRSNKHEILVAPGVRPCLTMHHVRNAHHVAHAYAHRVRWHVHLRARERVVCVLQLVCTQHHSHVRCVNSIHHRVSAASSGVGAFVDASAPLLFDGHPGTIRMRTVPARARARSLYVSSLYTSHPPSLPLSLSLSQMVHACLAGDRGRTCPHNE